MKSLHLLRSSVAFAAASLLCSPLLVARQDSAPNIAPSSAADPYPNTADGLHSLLTGLLTAARSNDTNTLWSKIADLEIPNYENWFARTYGEEKGPPKAQEYGKFLKVNEMQFEMLWTEFAKQEGEISIEILDAENRKFNLAKKDATLADPSDEFKAIWKKTDTSAGPATQSIAYFCFVDGKFRMKTLLHEQQILSTVKPGPVVPAKLINRVQPVYPETARKLMIQGSVAINVIIRKDGTVTVQNVGAGHPLLVPSAVDAVQQWKYSPTTVGGEPVDMQSKIYVIFDLHKQQADQKP